MRDVSETIRALLRKADDAAVGEHERAALLAKAAELRAKHSIDEPLADSPVRVFAQTEHATEFGNIVFTWSFGWGWPHPSTATTSSRNV